MEVTYPSEFSRVRYLVVAVAVVAVTTCGEYFFRRYVMFWLPTIGSLEVNDMISLLLVYGLLLLVFGLAMHIEWQVQLKGVGRSLRDMAKTWDYVPWLLLMAMSGALLPLLDRLLWGSARLMPWFTSSYRNPLMWLSGEAVMLKAASLIFVNGFFVPIAEEFIWRGIVQVRLARLMPATLAIGITAMLFSFKHVVVDDSFGRFLFIIAFGIICGIVAYRKDWRASAAVHLFTNAVATIIALATGMR